MTWVSPLPYAVVDRRIREVMAERMEQGATAEVDQRFAPLVAAWRRIERAGWFS